MRSFILLLKIQLLGLFGINKTLHADPAKARRTLALAALAVAAIVLFAAAYSSGVAQALVEMGLPEAVPLVAVLVGAVAGAVAAFLKTNGVLFGFKDYDLVMSLPVSTTAVVLSRIASLYAMSLAFGLLAMVPAFAVYAGCAGVSAAGVLCMALSVVLAPLLPLSVAIVLAVLIAAVSARFRHANIVVIALTLAATLAAVFGSIALSSQSDDLAALTALGTQLTAQIASVFPPAAWAAAGIVQGDLLRFFAFVAANLAVAGVVLALVVRLFVPVNALLASSRPSGAFSFDGKRGAAGLKASTPFRALVAKEARLLAATPVYLMNSCIGFVLVLVAALAVWVGTVTGLMSPDALPPELAPFVGALLPWALAFFCVISSTTAASVSLEGSARWLMLTAPVPASTVLGAKAAVNLMVAVPVVAVSAALLAVALPLDPLSVVALFVVPLASSLLAAFGGLALDARRPRYDWTTVYEPVKRGLPVFGVIVGGMAFVAAGAALTAVAGAIAGLALSLAAAAASWALFRIAAKRGLTA